MISKKGSLYSMIALFGTVLMVLCFVFMFVLGGFVIKDTAGTVFDEVRDIGMIGDNVNVTTYADVVFKPVEDILNNYALYAVVLYIFGIIFIFTLAFIFRGNVAGWNIALFVLCALLIVVFCIILSNTYEVFYTGTDDIGTGLRDAGAINYLILYSPAIMSIVIFIAGIIMMTGKEEGFR